MKIDKTSLELADSSELELVLAGISQPYPWDKTACKFSYFEDSSASLLLESSYFAMGS